MKHVLITGGAGVIGSHLCEGFLKRGYAVTAMDSFLTGKRSNLREIANDPAFRLVDWDVRKEWPLKTLSLMDQHGLDGVLHFACPASPAEFRRRPFDVLSVDSIGTIQAVDVAKANRARFLLASAPDDREINPEQARSCFDEAKRFAEAYVTTSIRQDDLNAAIARIFNPYGPRMRPDDGRVIPEFCMRALQGEPLTIFGDGIQTRTFCYIDDVVDGVIRLFESTVLVPVDLGFPSDTKIQELAQTVISSTGSQSAIEFAPARPNEPQRRHPELTLARQLLQWEPQTRLEAGLEKTLAFYRSHLIEEARAMDERSFEIA